MTRAALLASLCLAVLCLEGRARAQDAPGHQHEAEPPPAVDIPIARVGSGTSWMPDATPMRAVMGRSHGWDLMLHGTVFLQTIHEGGYFGGTQTGSINWLMASARRPVKGGSLQVRAMASLEPWTIRGCGYPDMLATGEQCGGKAIHERQHPHDAAMEVALEYHRPLTPHVGLQVYAAPVGEPALGPTAFPHRPSALRNPVAPIAHHWLDATHLSFGVVTAGVYGRRWKMEGSAFNGREPDDRRRNIETGALDSLSARLTWLPGPRWAAQASAGRLTEAEASSEHATRQSATLVTASVVHVRPYGMHGRNWASTLAWGWKHDGGRATSFGLAETGYDLSTRDTVYGRAELGTKTPHDLSIHGLTDPLGMGKLQAGYQRDLGAWRGWETALGTSLSASVPSAFLAPRYGARVTWGGAVFLQLLTAPMAMGAPLDPHAGHLQH